MSVSMPKKFNVSMFLGENNSCEHLQVAFAIGYRVTADSEASNWGYMQCWGMRSHRNIKIS